RRCGGGVALAVREVANDGVTYARLALVESGVQVEALLSEVIGQVLQEVSSAEIQLEASRVAEEKRKLEETRRRQEHEAFLVQFSFSLCAEVLRDCTEQVCAGLVEETLAMEIGLLAEDVLEAELQHIHKYIKRWRDVVAVRRQLKRQMRGFPAAPCGVDPRCRLWALVPSASQQPSLSHLARGVKANTSSCDDDDDCGAAPLAQRLLDFQRQIRASQEEERCCPGAAEGAPSYLSPRQRLFQSLAGPLPVLSSSSDAVSSPSLDITQTPVPQELLAGRLLRHLKANTSSCDDDDDCGAAPLAQRLLDFQRQIRASQEEERCFECHVEDGGDWEGDKEHIDTK
ncbi:hypothetical protein CRUP_018426, partial [Coryphaenoides rupestris]